MENIQGYVHPERIECVISIHTVANWGGGGGGSIRNKKIMCIEVCKRTLQTTGIWYIGRPFGGKIEVEDHVRHER